MRLSWFFEKEMKMSRSTDLTDAELELALNGACHTVEVVVWLAREVKRHRLAQRAAISSSTNAPSSVILLSGNAPLEVFPFVTSMHREVVLRHKDGESQDIEMTPDEADLVANQLRAAAARARAVKIET